MDTNHSVNKIKIGKIRVEIYLKKKIMKKIAHILNTEHLLGGKKDC